MSSKMQISKKLKSYDYLLDKETSSYDRFIGPDGARGSLYVKDDCISVTGDYKVLQDSVSKSSTDSKGCPEWKGAGVNKVLAVMKRFD